MSSQSDFTTFIFHMPVHNFKPFLEMQFSLICTYDLSSVFDRGSLGFSVQYLALGSWLCFASPSFPEQAGTGSLMCQKRIGQNESHAQLRDHQEWESFIFKLKFYNHIFKRQTLLDMWWVLMHSKDSKDSNMQKFEA